NGNTQLGFDSKKRPIIAYHKFDEHGVTQIYNARFEDGKWTIHQTTTDWTYRWDFAGGGTIPFDVTIGPPTLRNGVLTEAYGNAKHRGGTWKLDEETLKPIGTVPPPPSMLPLDFGRVESTFPGMSVRQAGDSGAGRYV